MDEFTTIVYICIAVITVILYKKLMKKKKLPPGPSGLPILGYYPFIAKDPLKTLKELRKKYGGIFGFHIGSQYVVLVSDHEAMVEAYKLSATVYRPEAVFGDVPYHLGIAGANGAEWSNVRRVMMKAFKDIGLHNTRWEDLIQEEIFDTVKSITNHGTDPIDVKTFFSDPFANNIISLVLGKRLEAGHPLTKVVVRAVDKIVEETPMMDLKNFSPVLAKIFQTLGIEKAPNLEEELQEFTKVVVAAVEEKMRKPDKETDDSFINLFCQELQNQAKINKVDKEYIENTVKGNTIALLTGASETSRTTLIYTLIAMAEYSEKQQKVQEELDRVIGQDNFIKWSDRTKIPYTFAALLESMRWKTIAPILALRMTNEDIRIQGYDIPKDTFITTYTWWLHNDPKYWKEPEKYIPERFLSEDGKKVNTDAKSYAPFSYGKRMCPGKLIAHMEDLQYFVSLLRNFTIKPSTGNKVNYDIRFGLTISAQNAELRFFPRY